MIYFYDRLQITNCIKVQFKIGSLLRCQLCRQNTELGVFFMLE